MFKPIDQTPRYKLVARQIAEHILDGSLPRGKKLPSERALVDSLGVSRATLREALIALEISGFVENRFGAGMAVTKRPPNVNLLDRVSGPGPFELLEARLLIEGEVAALAAAHISTEELNQLRQLTEDMRAESTEDFWGENADEMFHLTIARATRNMALENSVREFWRQRMQLPMWVQMHNRVNVVDMKPDLITEHELIVSALASRDPAQARRTMRGHIAQFGKQLLNAWSTLDVGEKHQMQAPGPVLIKAIGG